MSAVTGFEPLRYFFPLSLDFMVLPYSSAASSTEFLSTSMFFMNWNNMAPGQRHFFSLSFCRLRPWLDAISRWDVPLFYFFSSTTTPDCTVVFWSSLSTANPILVVVFPYFLIGQPWNRTASQSAGFHYSDWCGTHGNVTWRLDCFFVFLFLCLIRLFFFSASFFRWRRNGRVAVAGLEANDPRGWAGSAGPTIGGRPARPSSSLFVRNSTNRRLLLFFLFLLTPTLFRSAAYHLPRSFPLLSDAFPQFNLVLPSFT